MTMDLFDFMQDCTSVDCDHLPVDQRKFIGDWLVCGKCGEKLRPKDYCFPPKEDKK